MTYDAKYFGELFAATAKAKCARSNSSTPNDIRLSRVSAKSCTVEIPAEAAPYLARAGVFGASNAAVRQFAQKDFVTVLKRKFGKVTIL